MSVRLRFGWVDAGPSPDKLAQSTMAALSVEAGGAMVTSVLDRRNRIYSDEIVVPLFSVAEWLITNWWHIWYEIEDTGEQRPEFESRHNLAFAGEGFVLPSLTVTSTSGRMHLHWTRRRPRHTRIEFVDEGHADVEREELESEFRNLIDAVLERLHRGADTGAAADDLGRAWNAVNDLAPDEREFSRAAGLLGIDPFDVPDNVADAIVAFWERADPSVREDALATATEDSLTRVAAWLDGAIGTLAQEDRSNGWSDVRQALPPPPPGIEPWERGYTLARTARDRIGRNGGAIDFGQPASLAILQHETQPPSHRIHGLVAADTPACVTAPRGESGRRFLIARALGEYLGRSVPGPGLLSSLSTDAQAQSRAFAAEFLAPAASLRRRLTGGPVEAERVRRPGPRVRRFQRADSPSGPEPPIGDDRRVLTGPRRPQHDAPTGCLSTAIGGLLPVKITSKRQERVLDAMGLQPGDRLPLEERPDGFVRRPQRIDLTRLAPAREKLRRGRGTFDLQCFRNEPHDPALRD